MSIEIEEYKSVESDIIRFKRLLELLEEAMIKESPLKIGTLVERHRQNDSDKGLKFKVSSIMFDNNNYCLSYGIKLVGDDGDYDTYRCIKIENLKILKGN